jgi:hypothetical protein
MGCERGRMDMKGKGFIFMGMLAHSGVIDGVALPGFGRPCELLTIETDLQLNGENTATGSFRTSGLFSDKGHASDEFTFSKKRIQGVKTLVGSMGTISLKFVGRLTWTGKKAGIADGRFEIITCDGAYKSLFSVGESYELLDLSSGKIQATYTSTAYNY